VSRGELRWEIEDPDGQTRAFEPIPGESVEERARGRARLVAVRDRAGNTITLRYDERARLVGIVDAGGRRLEFENDVGGRLRRLWVPAPDGRGLRQHAEYRYDDAGDLVEVVDACGKSWRFEYDAHLLVRERDREGLSFYFEYDGLDRYARCVRTWGDGGIYDHVIEYDRAALRTIVRDSLGATTSYQCNGLGMVTEIVQADGTIVRREYGPTTWLAAEIDELGAATRYEYDARGNRVKVTLPETQAGPRVTEIRYDDDDRPVELVEPTGATWRWTYDAKGRLAARIDPLGHATNHEWADGDLVALVDAAGARTELGWDRAHNLVSITGPDGQVTRRSYDALGRVVAILDVRGNAQRRHHDACGRLLRTEEPDGNVREVIRDGEGRVVRARDRLREVSLGYTGMGWLASHSVGGCTVQSRYDTEGRLVGVLDERGREHRFERDLVGRVRLERAVDGTVTRFDRDAAGRIVAEHRPDEVIVRHAYDGDGLRVESVYPRGGTERFRYDAAGRLVEASNDDIVIGLERDRLGRVILERSARTDTAVSERVNVEVHRRFDHHGRVIATTSSLGAEVTIERSVMGDVTRVAQSRGRMAAWEARFARDAMGEEVERVLPGGARSQWWRDAVGRPTQHVVAARDRAHRARRYRWDVGDRLLGIAELAHGVDAAEKVFEHDARGALVLGAWAGDMLDEAPVDGRFPDDLGRIFASAMRTDREYTDGGALCVRCGVEGATTYHHDAEGRLVARRGPDGSVTRFHWNDVGRLVQVDRADGTAVAMTYDPLGRRLSKHCDGVQTCFVADGEHVLHEWREPAAGPEPRPVPGEGARRIALLELREALKQALPAEDAEARWVVQLANVAREFPRLVAELRGDAVPASPAPALAEAEVLTWLFEPGRYAPLARITVAGAHSIVADHVGRPLVVLDGAGEAQAQLAIDSWGRAAVSGDPSLCPWRFAGQYRDDETGLHYNRFRYYDPDAGHYISRDPLGLRAGLRVYGYVEDPEVASDPLGLSPQPGSGCSTQQVGPHKVGPYKSVGGHHPRQQAARSNNPNYDPDAAIAIDDASIDHAAMSRAQLQINAEVRRQGVEYTEELEDAIARDVLRAGGVADENIEEILAMEAAELSRQGARAPTRTPGTRRGT
jgi:RHS repeat-associated protein